MVTPTAFLPPVGVSALRPHKATISRLTESRIFGRPLGWLTSDILSRVRSMTLIGDAASISRLLCDRSNWPFLESLTVLAHEIKNEHVISEAIANCIGDRKKHQGEETIDEAVFNRMLTFYTSIARTIRGTELKSEEGAPKKGANSRDVDGVARDGKSKPVCNAGPKNTKDGDGVCEAMSGDTTIGDLSCVYDRDLTLRLPVLDTVAINYDVLMIAALRSVASLTSMDLDLTWATSTSLHSPVLGQLSQLKHLYIRGGSTDRNGSLDLRIFPDLPHGSLTSLKMDVCEPDGRRLTWTESLSCCLHLTCLELQLQQGTCDCELLAKNLAHLPKLTTLILGLGYFITLNVSALARLPHLLLLRASYLSRVSELVGVENLQAARPSLEIVQLASDQDPFEGEE
jgi:hypothetical protein